LLSTALGACTGNIVAPQNGSTSPAENQDGGQSGGSRPGSTSGTGSGLDNDQDGIGPVDIPRRPLRRLTRTEYNNTVRDLLGDTSKPASRFPEETSGALGFLQATDTSDATFSAVADVAETLSASATNQANLGKLLPCSTVAAPADSCAQTFISNFGRRVFRRPLTDGEKAEFFSFFSTARNVLSADFRMGIRVVLEAFLQSPEFLYHWEVGSQKLVAVDNVIELGPFELASRLSYFVWQSMPDDALLSTAEQGKLSQLSDVSREVIRLLDDPKAGDSISDFFSQLLDLKSVTYLEKVAIAGQPEWTQIRKDAAYADAVQFIKSVALDNQDDKTSLATLLTAPYGFVNEASAPFYGLTDIRGTEHRKVPLPPQRVGLLTQLAFLAGHSGPADGASATPIKRGRTIRSRLLCQAIPPPTDNIVPRPSSGATTRQRLSEHAADPGCRSCHQLMDPLGFALESFGATGVFRTKEGSATIDTSGVLDGLEGEASPFDGAPQLMTLIANAPETLDCVAQSFVRFATGRHEVDNESANILRALPDADRSLRSLILAVATSPGFTHRGLISQEKP
jgi:Protein of unknown function (DUF1592)/Protein of unknown function (DUF1588)/Protein of unknown function (DUF1595)/Protein of unknown function (DUF1587)/Protein of unknown function (DUF1585)